MQARPAGGSLGPVSAPSGLISAPSGPCPSVERSLLALASSLPTPEVWSVTSLVSGV